jgi:16S rRNA (uracil1498-N3)-methyltransferase
MTISGNARLNYWVLKKRSKILFCTSTLASHPPKILTGSNGSWKRRLKSAVTSVTPVICTRSERRSLKMERLIKVMLSAMKQSLRLTLPRIEPIMPFKEFVHRIPGDSDNDSQRIICHCQSQNLPMLKSFYRPGSRRRG